MPVTYMQMVATAMAAVPGISPEEVYRRMQHEPHLLLIDVREAEDIATQGMLADSINIALGRLPLRADQEIPPTLRDPRLQDRTRPIVTLCEVGYNAARGAKLLRDMGFTSVQYMEGGIEAWIAAGLPLTQPQ
ncbi:MAG: rhodanese-like domain-containing protein [Chloroflexaceae bacterium]